MAISHLKLSVTMVTGTSEALTKAKGPESNMPGLPLYVIFVFLLLSIFSNTTLKFFHYYFEVSTICDEYIRYWNKPGKWKYTSPGQKAPGTRVRFNRISGYKRKTKVPLSISSLQTLCLCFRQKGRLCRAVLT